MLGDIAIDDVSVEVVGEVEDVMRDPELLSYSPGVFHVGDRAAPGVGITTPEFHGGADHVVAGFLQERVRLHPAASPATGAVALEQRILDYLRSHDGAGLLDLRSLGDIVEVKRILEQLCERGEVFLVASAHRVRWRHALVPGEPFLPFPDADTHEDQLAV
jgi:hypothetical protein